MKFTQLTCKFHHKKKENQRAEQLDNQQHYSACEDMLTQTLDTSLALHHHRELFDHIPPK